MDITAKGSITQYSVCAEACAEALKSKIFEFSGKHYLGAEINERRIQLLNEPFESLGRVKAWDSPASARTGYGI